MATGEKLSQASKRNPAAVALGRLGGLKGGKARAKAMTPEQRKAIAQKAAETRWGSKKAIQTERSIGELKMGLEMLAKSSEKHGTKIDSLNETVHTAKGFLKAITIIGSVFGAVGLALLAAIFKMLGDYLSKH